MMAPQPYTLINCEAAAGTGAGGVTSGCGVDGVGWVGDRWVHGPVRDDHAHTVDRAGVIPTNRCVVHRVVACRSWRDGVV
jgi:hypothetical protein